MSRAAAGVSKNRNPTSGVELGDMPRAIDVRGDLLRSRFWASFGIVPGSRANRKLALRWWALTFNVQFADDPSEISPY